MLKSLPKKYFPTIILMVLAVASLFASCDDDISGVGNSLITDQVNITVDSTLYKLEAQTTYDASFDARSQNFLVGKVAAKQYGALESGFVAKLMPSLKFNMPDSISPERIDSVRIVLRARRGALTGDSLLPQQLSIYKLNKQLPSAITSSFDPAGYYETTPLAKASYTFTKLADTDTIFKKAKELRISAKVPTEWGKQIYDAYKQNPSIFAWPSTFAEKFPGVFVKHTFGNGCLGEFKSLEFMVYWHRLREETKLVDDEVVTSVKHIVDSTAVFATAPEVLCSNVIKYTPSQFIEGKIAEGQKLVSTPGGYVTKITFPLQEMLEKYKTEKFSLSVIGDLKLTVPATVEGNDIGLKIAPYLLMVKTSKLKDFFENNRVPNGKDSFWAKYNSDKGCYNFSSMRSYFLNAIENESEITPDDTDFTLVPVNITSETYNDPWTYKEVTTITFCKPYMGVPGVTVLHTDKAMICLTYTTQLIE